MGANKLPYFCYTLQIEPGITLGDLPTPNAISAVTALLNLLAEFHKMESFAMQTRICQITAENLTPSVKYGIWLRLYMQHNWLATAVSRHCNISKYYNPFRAIYYLLVITSGIFALNQGLQPGIREGY